MRPTATRPALVHSVTPAVRGWPSIPLIGLAEARVVRGLRDGGMKMREIAAAVDYLRGRSGPHALANPDLLHDGTQALVRDTDGITALRTGQPLLPGIVDEWLEPFRLAPDGYVEAYLVQGMPGVEIDPRFSSGRMRFTRTGIPVFAIAGVLEAGDPPEMVAAEYGLTGDEVRLVHERLPWLSEAA